jgi:hypothetical protein
MATNSGLTVAQTALLLPELLELIFHHVRLDHTNSDYDDEYLVPCGLVSKLWFHECMRNLWGVIPIYYGDPSKCNLPNLLRPIAPARRQFYASLIERAVLVFAGVSTAAEDDDALCGIAFPRLTALTILVQRPGYKDPPHVPRIENHRVVELLVDPPYECQYPESFGVSEEEWEVIGADTGERAP